MTWAAPAAFAAAHVNNPTGPAPSTKTTSPGLTLALSMAYIPTDSGSTNAPSSSEMSSGSLDYYTNKK